MKISTKIAWFIAGLFLVLSIYHLNNSNKRESANNRVDITPIVNELAAESEAIFNTLNADGTFDTKRGEELKKRKWYAVTHAAGNIIYWNSNKVDLDTQIFEQGHFPLLYQFGDDTYCAFNKANTFLLFRLANDGKIHPDIAAKHPSLDGRMLHPLQHRIGNDFTLDTSLASSDNFKVLLFALLAIAILFTLLLFYLEHRTTYHFICVGIMLGVEVLLYLYLQHSASIYFLSDITGFTVFSPSEALVLLFIHLLTGLSLILTLVVEFQQLPSWLFEALTGIIILFASDLLIDLSILLSKDAPISFDFERVFGLTAQTFASIAFIGLSIASIWLLIYSSKLFNRKNIPWGVLLAIAGFSIFQIMDASRSLPSLAIPVGIVLLSGLSQRFIKSTNRSIYFHFVYTSLLTSLIVYTGQVDREQRHIEDFALQLIDNRDEDAERILRQVENQLAQEFLVPEDFNNFYQNKDVIENRILQLYFSNYLKKYELRLFSFDSIGQNVNQNGLYTYGYLDNQYNKNTQRTLSDYFYLIDQPEKFYGYIAKYENCDIDGHNGTTFILLQPRVVESEFLYPEVFANQRSREVVDVSEYSYGIYFRNRLINQKGVFSYPLTYLTELLEREEGMDHSTFIDRNYRVILSSPSKGLLDWLPSLTFSLALLLPLSFLISLVTRWLFNKKHPIAVAFLPGSSKYLSSRIQTSLTILLLAGLLLSVYIIIGFIRTNYNENLENQLLVQVKNIGSRIQDRIDLEKKLMDNEQRTLILNEEANTHKVDINLFHANGELLGSTKPYLTENQVLAPRMNPKAYSRLTDEEHSFLLIQEELEGSDYLSAYVPLFDSKNNVIGYLNTPFFAKNEVLNKQISSLIVNVLNIYFLLLLAGVFIAYIISKQVAKPLVLIRDKIAKTVLLGQNELIVYERDDEIGQLVRQYNKMVLELQESASQLAESEREGAWREMAKQVAHEIKNPLTPMKLSIQHLQRAYTTGSGEKLDKLFQKTSKLLIEQIDSLSDMASEFSNFAKMPEDNYTDFDIAASLNKVTDLFLRTENVSITRDIEEGVWVHADENQIQRVFNNLIKNAIQAIPEKRNGQITVRLHTSGKEVFIRVADNGSGISDELKNKVFVPNFSTKNSGMGLGLAICKKIIETAGGSIQFTSKLNKGTTFELNLPTIEKT